MSRLTKTLRFTRHIFLVFCCISTAKYALADALGAAQERVKEFSGVCFFDIANEEINIEDIIIEGAITTVEIGGIHKTTAYIVDPASIICGDVNLGMCGSRGCPITIFAENTSYSYTGWQPTPINHGTQTLLLLPHSGWVCGREFNVSPCFSVIAWDQETRTFTSARTR